MLEAGESEAGQPDVAANAATAMYAWLDDALRDGAGIVTANRRLARELRRVYDERQLLAGNKGWKTPRIVSFEVWLHTLLDSARSGDPMPLRLNAAASAILWERHLLEESASTRPLNPGGLVRQARQAWQRLNDWSVAVEELERSAGNEDERLFATAASAYRRQLLAQGWIDGALLAGEVARRLEAGELVAPERVVLAGFDRIAPSTRRILSALEAGGCRVATAPAPGHDPTPHIVSCADSDAELRTAGAWARRQLAADARARVAIVHPVLEQDAARAARLVREGFAPGWQAGDRRYAAAVQVSLGNRLVEYPLVAVAMLWLEWTHRGLTSREVSVLLRTPLIGTGVTDGCSRLELELRRMPDRTWSAATLAAALRDRDTSDDAQAWLARVDRVAASQFGNEAPVSPTEWAGRIDRLLGVIGWPGEKRRDSLEFQLVNRWRELLNEFSRIEVVQRSLGFAEALLRLKAAAAEAVYQPETARGMVQLIGTLEAAGLAFDRIWIGNLHALQWPPPAHPLPLVSRALQRRAGMPDATPADTFEYSQRTLARLVGSAPVVVLSWPQMDSESALTPSPLLAQYSGRRLADVRDPGWYASSFCGVGAVEAVPRDPAPAVRADERIRGGARTVQRQVTEPLSAFAYGRLGVTDLPAFETGLSPRTCGSIIHAALCRLMLDRPSSVELRKWSADERGTRIESAIGAALAPHATHADGVLRRLLALERRRLRIVLQSFLEKEVRRADFFVDSVEAALQLMSHGVRLDLRVDRIDRLRDGSLLIIDYKSGAGKNLLDRNGEPTDLQLVVYAAALDRAIGGLALVNVAGSGIRYRGIGSSVEWNTLAPEVWQERLASWKKRVDEAIGRFAEGDVRVNTTRSTDDNRPLNLLSRTEELRRAL